MNCNKSLKDKKASAKFCGLRCKNQYNGHKRTLQRQKKRIQELKDEEEDIDKISEEYKFLLDGTPLNEQMVQFAKLSFDRSITKEDVDKYINNEE